MSIQQQSCVEAMKLMLHEMEYVLDCINNHVVPFDGDDFHEALRLGRQAIAIANNKESSNAAKPKAAVAEQHKQEPNREPDYSICPTCVGMADDPIVPQEYRHRQWVGLTDKEKEDCLFNKSGLVMDYEDVVNAVEAKLKEKNAQEPKRRPSDYEPLTNEQYFEIGQRHWLSSNKIEQIHKELIEATHGINAPLKGEA